jgi:hypothetical protein
MNNEEFDHASGIVEETNDLALKFLCILRRETAQLPPPGAREKLYGCQTDPKKRTAWDLACVAVHHCNEDDPAALAEKLLDELNAQTEPCTAAKDADLAA